MPTTSNNSTNTLMCILSYLGLFALIPYFTQKDDAYITWHAKQGLLITAIAIVISFSLSAMSFLPGIGWIAGMVSMLFSLAVLGLCVYCMVQACNGRKWAVPGLSSLAGK